MNFLEVYRSMLELIVAGIFTTFVSGVFFVILALADIICCKIYGKPLEMSCDKFVNFYLEGFLPTMLVLGISVIILKHMLGVGE